MLSLSGFVKENIIEILMPVSLYLVYRTLVIVCGTLVIVCRTLVIVCRTLDIACRTLVTGYQYKNPLIING